MSSLGYEEDTGQYHRIAQISLAFFNEGIIKFLRDRGKLIQTENWEKVDKINDEIA